MPELWNRADFGKPIIRLRREHVDERGLHWTQETLAHEANLTVAVSFAMFEMLDLESFPHNMLRFMFWGELMEKHFRPLVKKRRTPYRDNAS